MKKFILQIIIFLIFLFISSEITIRVFNLISDIPQRVVDDSGIQKYLPDQKGQFDGLHWETNEHGWIGIAETEGDIITIIGDSFIENLMNPIDCNQGALLKKHYPQNSFFEAGRSGITLIEAIKIASLLQEDLYPKFQLIYVNTNDFLESASNLTYYSDRYQVDLNTGKERAGQIKYKNLKKIIYRIKTLYYLYKNFPIFVEEQNKATDHNVTDIAMSDTIKLKNDETIKNLYQYIVDNYDTSSIAFIFHPGIDDSVVKYANEFGVHHLELESDDIQAWRVSESDGHWNCYGHTQVSTQVAEFLSTVL